MTTNSSIVELLCIGWIGRDANQPSQRERRPLSGHHCHVAYMQIHLRAGHPDKAEINVLTRADFTKYCSNDTRLAAVVILLPVSTNQPVLNLRSS